MFCFVFHLPFILSSLFTLLMMGFDFPRGVDDDVVVAVVAGNYGGEKNL